jgi:hypothetical protein
VVTAVIKLEISGLEFTNKLRILRALKSLHVVHSVVETLQPALSESLTMSDLLLQGTSGIRAPCRLAKIADPMGEGLS